MTEAASGKAMPQDRMLGRNEAIEAIRKKITCIARCDVNVLITGENGTGKDLAARVIHSLSARAARAFIIVSCGTIPEGLFENELFGHIRGAYTGAGLSQVGLVREADGGTLFLDEIGVISPIVQAKLLRLIQDREYRALGDPKPKKADVRIIAATNRDLKTLIKKELFIEDLFYRLNIISLHIPPLRERREDIPILIDHFVEKYAREYGKAVIGVSSEAKEVLMACEWPGNVRELENLLQQAIILSSGPFLDVGDFQLLGRNERISRSQEAHPEPLKQAKKRTVSEFERSYLIELLHRHNGNVVRSAREAGLGRTALWNLLKKHGLSPKAFR
jgi:two-component system, NtrC family, response regulator GlrR